MPPALREQPAITPEHRFYFDAFFFLSRFRSPGFSGPGALNFADVLSYARLLGYTSEDEILFFSDVMAACDGAYQTHIHETSKKSEPKRSTMPGAKSKPPSRPLRR